MFQTAPSHPSGSRAWRVVVADDHREMRSLLRLWLEMEGLSVVEARNGSELVRCIVKEPDEPGVDLVISDVRMPSFSGLEILRGICPIYPKLPIILITGFGAPELHREAIQLGAYRVLDKPVPQEMLTKVVLQALARKAQPPGRSQPRLE